MITEHQLSHWFYLYDPMGTCCNVNKQMEDEYDRPARHIVQQLKFGIPFKTAVHDIFSFFWRNGCLIEHSFIVAIVEAQYYNHMIRQDMQY